MDGVMQFLERHGWPVFFVGVFADQLGMPVPGLPLLLTAGALAGRGTVHPAGAVGLAVAAAVLADLLWYELGRRRGGQALRLGCRVSLEPDSCVRRTQEVFVRHGVRLLLFARFVPALGTVAAALTGMARVGRRRFLLYDAMGALFWAGGYMGLGYALTDQLGAVADSATHAGGALGIALVAVLLVYVLAKYVRRQLFLRGLRVRRLTADDLRRKVDAGEPLVVIDLRHPLDVDAAPYAIPGALRMAVEDLESRRHEIPRDRDLVLYCT